MKTYTIKYDGHSVNVRGNDTVDAIQRYGSRLPFGNMIFVNIRTKTVDADTRGCVWGIFDADGKRVEVDLAIKKENWAMRPENSSEMKKGYEIVDCKCPICGAPSTGFRDAEGLVNLKCWKCTLFPDATAKHREATARRIADGIDIEANQWKPS